MPLLTGGAVEAGASNRDRTVNIDRANPQAGHQK
jgi:hypothetical protein